MLKKVLMPSLTDTSFKLQKSFTKRKLVSKTCAGQDLMLVQDVWSPERNHRLFGLPEKLHISCVRPYTMLKQPFGKILSVSVLTGQKMVETQM